MKPRTFHSMALNTAASKPKAWKPGVALALAACVALAGCSGMQRDRSSGSSGTSGTSGTSGSSSSGYEGADHRGGRSGGMAGTASGTGSSGSMGDSAAMPGVRGVVQSIERMTRQQAGISVSGAPGAAAVGGSLSGSGSDQVYRVTLRTEDGSTQSYVVEATPDYNVGDRVSYSSGSIQRQ